jgi:hypothetical protein
MAVRFTFRLHEDFRRRTRTGNSRKTARGTRKSEPRADYDKQHHHWRNDNKREERNQRLHRPCALARPSRHPSSRPGVGETHTTKVLYAAGGSADKILVDYVTRRFNASSAGLKSRLGSLTFAEAPFSAISRFNCSPRSQPKRAPAV